MVQLHSPRRSTDTRQRCQPRLEAIEDRCLPGDTLGSGLLTNLIADRPPAVVRQAAAAAWSQAGAEYYRKAAPPSRANLAVAALGHTASTLTNPARAVEIAFSASRAAEDGFTLAFTLETSSPATTPARPLSVAAADTVGSQPPADVSETRPVDGGTVATAPPTAVNASESAQLVHYASIDLPPDTGRGPGTMTVRQVNLPANDLVYNPQDGMIYASVPSRAGPGLGNTLAVVDPVNATLRGAVHLGSEPGKLAISDNGQYIYASLDGAASIRRFDTTTQQAGLRFPLTTAPDGPRWVEDLAVQPGNPDVIAVARQQPGFSPRHAGTVIYENGVRRTNLVREGNVIEFGATPNRLYGYNNEISSFGFSRVQVDATGANLVDVTAGLISGFGVDMVYEAGRMYTTNGRVLDPEARQLLGTYSASGLVRPDAGQNITYFLSGGSLRAHNLTTFTLMQTYTISGVSGPRSLIRWGDNGLAFSSLDNSRVFLLTFSGVGPGSRPVPPIAPPLPALPVSWSPLPTRPLTLTVRQASLLANDLVYPPGGNLIWASVPGSVVGRGNTLTAIDTTTALLGNSVFVGSEPTKMAISDNAQYIYVGLNGAGAVRRFDVASQTADIQFALNQPPDPVRFPEDLSVQPGNPNVVAVSTNRPFSPRHAGLFIFDNGVRRTNAAPEGNTITFGDDPGRLYTYNNEISSFGFARMAVDASGVRVTDVLGDLLYGYGLQIKYADGWIYTQVGGPLAQVGRTIDPETRLITGTYWSLPTGAVTAIDPGQGRVYYVFGNTLRVYDLTTFVPVAQFTIPGVSGSPGSLIRYGSDGLAFRTSGGQVFLMNLR